jgi:hypothetical protein
LESWRFTLKPIRLTLEPVRLTPWNLEAHSGAMGLVAHIDLSMTGTNMPPVHILYVILMKEICAGYTFATQKFEVVLSN